MNLRSKDTSPVSSPDQVRIRYEQWGLFGLKWQQLQQILNLIPIFGFPDPDMIKSRRDFLDNLSKWSVLLGQLGPFDEPHDPRLGLEGPVFACEAIPEIVKTYKRGIAASLIGPLPALAVEPALRASLRDELAVHETAFRRKNVTGFLHDCLTSKQERRTRVGLLMIADTKFALQDRIAEIGVSLTEGLGISLEYECLSLDSLSDPIRQSRQYAILLIGRELPLLTAYRGNIMGQLTALRSQWLERARNEPLFRLLVSCQIGEAIWRRRSG